MESTMSLIRFLMFIIFALVIILKLLSHKLSEDDEIKEDESSEVTYKSSNNSNNTKSENIYDSGYGIPGNDSNIPDDDAKIDSVITNIQWKKALEYEKDSNDMYYYTNDDVDKLTLMSSDDMIFCLKNNNHCKEMEFEKCRKEHIATYMDKNSCLAAKSAMSTMEYCLNDGSCDAIKKSDECISNIRFSNKENCEKDNIKD